MAIATKGSRSIRVEGREYRWAFSRKSGFIVVIVEAKATPGQRLAATIPYEYRMMKASRSVVKRPCSIIPPALVRRCIVAGLSAGWQPEKRGVPVQIEVEGKDLLQLDFSWLHFYDDESVS